MSFWARFKESFYSPEFYKRVAHEPLSLGFKYLVSLLAIGALAVSGILAFEFIPFVQDFSNRVVVDVVAQLPEGLEFYIKGNTASTNATSSEPIFITAQFDATTTRATFVVVDTTQAFSVNQFGAYRSYVWVAQDGIGYVDDTGVSFTPFEAETDGLTLTREMVVSGITKAKSYLWILYALVVPVLFLLFLFINMFTFLSLLVSACFVWLIAWAKGIKLTYKSAYLISLYAITPSLLISFLGFLIPGFGIPYAYSVIFLVVVALNLDKKLFAPTE